MAMIKTMETVFWNGGEYYNNFEELIENLGL